MKLFELVNILQEDFDTYDTVYDAEVTVCFIEENEDNDNYDKFCIGIIKKVEVVKGNGNHGLIVKWNDLIKNNMDKFKAFSAEHWCEDCQYEDDDDEFVYQWIDEIHNYMTGCVSEDFYGVLVEFVESLEVLEKEQRDYEVQS